MATGKRFYWIKLKDTFMTSDAVDFLMGQPDGANYVVLYQMLCLKTVNTGGKLERRIGEVIIPYDEAKIQRDTKWFSIDTVRIALNLYKALGLIYIDEDGCLSLTNHENLVGSETDYAIQKKLQRQSKLPELPVDIVHTDVHKNVHTEIRDRDKRLEIEIRDKRLEIDTRDKSVSKEKEIHKEKESSIVSDETICRTEDVRRVVEAWNALNLQNVRKVPDAKTKAGQMLRCRIREYGVETVLEAVEKVRDSDFLMGRTGSNWNITLDWFSRPNNFPKVVNGNYDNKKSGNPFIDSLKEDGYDLS